MRKRISQIARGKFEYAKPVVSFSEEKVNLTVIEGREENGSFEIYCKDEEKIRGVVYSTDPRMECLTSQFEGEDVRIRYQFHSRGLAEGDVCQGNFVIVYNQCEYSLPFCVTISRLYADTSQGLIRNLYDFCSLARENWQEAYKLFYNKSFANIIGTDEIKEAMIYKGIVAAKPCSQNMEEFLIGIQKKKPVEISVDKSKLQYNGLLESVSDSFEIKKDNWGYVEIRVSCDCEFIRLSKPLIYTEDFIGSTYIYDFLIDANALHGGNNYGRIYISSAYQTYTIDVMVSAREEKTEKEESVRLQIQECKVGIMELYQAYRLKRLVKGVWANETIDILNHLHALDPDQPMYLLMKAQAYIINRQRQEAEWILDEFKREWVDHKAPIWGYYLYLMTLMEREPAYVDKMTQEIEGIFHENPDSVLLFWVLSFLQEQYFNNNGRRLKAFEYWISKGCSSPYLYIEAFYLMWQDPYLLNKLDKFEIRVLRWAIRRQALTKEIAAQIFQVVEVSRNYNPKIFDLLRAAYEVNPKDEYIGLICSYLIKGQQYEPKFHSWYEKGIELELRITGLYEAFLLSMDERKIDAVPKIIQMYFQYDSALSYRKMAVLYNNIIASKEINQEVYHQYQRAMGKFAMEQIEQGHMDDNLAVVYEDMLDLGFINEELAHDLAGILYTNKLIIFDSKMVRAIIYQRQMTDPQIVPVKDCVAFFQLFSEDYVILFEDEKGRRYVGSVSYRLQKLMNDEKYLDKCIELAPNEISYIISRFKDKKSHLEFVEEDKKYFPYILFGRETSAEYKAQMVPEILRFYQNGEYDRIIKDFLYKTDFDTLDVKSRRYLLDMLVWNHMYDEAYDLVGQYGIDQIGTASKVNLSVYMINRLAGECDDFLVKLAMEAFLSKKYNDSILEYLCQFYNGPSMDMLSIWEAARSYEVDTFEFEDRLINQVVYSDGDLKAIEDLFMNYFSTGGKELTVLAYITAAAHRFFLSDRECPDRIMEIIENRYIYGKDLNDACRLALLKYYSGLEELTQGQYVIEDELLAEYTCRNMNFAFYKKLERDLINKYHLYDKVFLEYRYRPGAHVVLHYNMEENSQEFKEEDMQDLYYGIYVKPFVMFFGEMVKYYISEEHDGQLEVTESSRIANNNVYNEERESRYNLINQMLISETLQEETSLYHNMKQYQGYANVTEQVFKIL